MVVVVVVLLRFLSDPLNSGCDKGQSVAGPATDDVSEQCCERISVAVTDALVDCIEVCIGDSRAGCHEALATCARRQLNCAHERSVSAQALMT